MVKWLEFNDMSIIIPLHLPDLAAVLTSKLHDNIQLLLHLSGRDGLSLRLSETGENGHIPAILLKSLLQKT